VQAVAEGPKDVIGTDGGLTARRVVVEGDQDAGPAKIGGATERDSLAAGQGGAAGSQSGVMATPFNATHIALPEIAHMLLGHQHRAAWDKFVTLLAPDVDRALIQLILGRSAYNTAEER